MNLNQTDLNSNHQSFPSLAPIMNLNQADLNDTFLSLAPTVNMNQALLRSEKKKMRRKCVNFKYTLKVNHENRSIYQIEIIYLYNNGG